MNTLSTHMSGAHIRAWRRPSLMIATAHALLFALSGLFAFLLRFDFQVRPPYVQYMLYALPIWVVVKSIVFAISRLNCGSWRYVSLPDIVTIAVGNACGSAASAALIYLVIGSGFPRSICLLDFLVCLHGSAGLRLVARMAAEAGSRAARGERRPTLIYGAGSAGVMLLRELRGNASLGYEVRGFIDDDHNKRGTYIQRVAVLGSGAELAGIVRRHGITQVLIAIPSADSEEMTRILRTCRESNVSCKTVPGFSDIIEGRCLTAQIRDVAVEDLLGRKPVSLDESLIREQLQDRVVMVTGAAGSIGSELCRQIARFQPRCIVGFEIAETALFHMEREMRELFPGVRFAPEIGNIQNSRRIEQVLDTHGPSVIYHAAAYKHVPMMEAHIFEAAENNIFGTYNVARLAAGFDVERFVMISSDKAVHPANVMGTTKRVAELLIGAMHGNGTKYFSVRFGNVLGSSGSVIPIFKQQIAAGGPVTVTHPEMRRYFMTIPEAAQLVLQASAIGQAGEIFVLDMGQPVKIVDLAHKLILLSGLPPSQQIRIEFTGIRPGEKLFEELSTEGEDTVPTDHEKIKIFIDREGAFDIRLRLGNLRRAIDSRDERGLILELKEIVPEYNLGTHILRRLLERPPESRTAGLRAAATLVR
ncbi:MAG TPA: nucleoside-diphosphate sugar epimerase/dehydratase [Bryobacteraceae bacterium]|nr:nucleoside-diphosphate sugar epimerase/dehydratase [Bryobacteraceae bacterium]